MDHSIEDLQQQIIQLSVRCDRYEESLADLRQLLIRHFSCITYHAKTLEGMAELLAERPKKEMDVV